MNLRLSDYKDWTTVRAFIKAIPWGGESIDFWLREKTKCNERKLDIWTTEPFSSRLKSMLNMVDVHPFNGHVLLRELSLTPTVKLSHLGHFQIDSEQKALARYCARVLRNKRHPDDPCAVLMREPAWGDDPLMLNYHSLLYSEILALREQGKLVKMLSANVVVYSEEARCLLLHRRSIESADFLETLHTFGGAYMPPGEAERGDYGGLIECAERELQEETGLSIAVPGKTPFVILEEPSIYFVQIAFLGLNVPGDHLERTRATWEGDVVRISFDDLECRLLNVQDWTPSGLLHVLMWLALDIPNSNRRPLFNGKRSGELFDTIIRAFGS